MSEIKSLMRIQLTIDSVRRTLDMEKTSQYYFNLNLEFKTQD